MAWDTELLGLHWHEGVLFLAAVLEEAEAAGLRIAPLDELVAEADGGAGGDRRRRRRGARRGRSTRGARRGPAGSPGASGGAELRALPGGSPRALRELLALQSSDWAFLVAHGTAGDYPLRARGGARGGARTRARGRRASPALRGLAPFLALD